MRLVEAIDKDDWQTALIEAFSAGQHSAVRLAAELGAEKAATIIHKMADKRRIPKETLEAAAQRAKELTPDKGLMTARKRAAKEFNIGERTLRRYMG